MFVPWDFVPCKSNECNLNKEMKTSIKKEKAELYSLAHYVDDRIELVKQIFSSLKPKTIKNLAPEFLKNATIDDIQELCCTELLGISTKRLVSIINATKCPSDTESSDSDDKIEEHISLEEISSDSEQESIQKSQDKKNKRKTAASNSQENKKINKEISVLELLELQARARAIRSQLALEPIAKIEVDSDDSGNYHREKSNESTRKRHSDDHQHGSRCEEPNKRSSSVGVSKSPPKRIKLKRNFRKSNKNNSGEEEENEQPKPDGKFSKNRSTDIKKEKSPSPDVITILPSPETLCISDSSDEECEVQGSISTSEGNFRDQIVEEKANQNPKGTIESDIEEGEILEKEEQENEDNRFQSEEKKYCATQTPEIHEKVDEEHQNGSQIKSCLEENSNEGHHNDDVISLEHEEIYDESKENIESVGQSSEEKHEQQNTTFQYSKAEDIDIFHEPISYIELNDDSSEDETEHDEEDKNGYEESTSWNFRWLKSSKVSRILAISKLGNRVRDKIKRLKKAEQDEGISNERTKDLNNFFSSFEDGSVEQYHDILNRGNSSQ